METVETPNSSNIRRFSFGDKLIVEFKSGEKWEYDAPRKAFDDMKRAKSAGRFFHAQVRGRFKGRRIDDE